MGIPSFYRHLVKTNPKLIKKEGGLVSVLALDLNCAIYHCLSKLQKKTPYEVSRATQFEDALIQSVIFYIIKLRDHVKPTDMLYVAIDGVVPMAKIRQQRMRRFKSVWMSGEEAKIKGATGDSWDRNSITPGTAFMDKLTLKLDQWASTQPKTIISGVNCSGEGEQKIMSYLRYNPPCGQVVVYGLDADLIILCLWHHSQYNWQFKLLREDVEMKGGVKLNQFGQEQLLYFDINDLASILVNKLGVPLTDYVGAMSFLGNDFVPHGLTLCIREDGIDLLMEILKKVGIPLVERVDGNWQYNQKCLLEVVRLIAKEEEHWVSATVIKKLKMNGYRNNSKEVISDVEKELNILNALPLTWKAEKEIAIRTEEGWTLREDWRIRYYEYFLWQADPKEAVKQWYKATHWILEYYTGSESVDLLWYYPWYLPPLFEDIYKYKECLTDGHGYFKKADPISSKAQLLMVLPIESYRLLPRNLRSLPIHKPEFFPSKWTFFSAGRRQLWECEPMIPMLPFEIVRKIFRSI